MCVQEEITQGVVSLSVETGKMPPGLQGTVAYIDDAGQIHMHWENGRSLALIPGEDSFHRIDGPANEVPKSEKAKKERSRQR